jgi:putative peptidoglycan lipid II flippase
MSLARNTLVQSGLTLGSRILGFARDLAISARFGQGPMSDAFTTALMFPNLFRRLFAEGAFAQAFVPIYGKAKVEHGDEEAARTASDAMSFLMFWVVVFCIVMQLAMGWLMPYLLSAYAADPQMMALATALTQLTFPYLACMTLASLLSGVLNTAGRFALSAGVPVLLNICTLVPLVLLYDTRTALFGAAIAVTVAGALQAGLLWWGVARQKITLRFHAPKLTPAVKNVLIVALPGALAGGALQINSIVSQLLTGSDEGARTVLYNADRLYQLPLGLVGVAIGLALVPRLTRSFVQKDEATSKKTMDDGVSLSMAFTLPAAVALFCAPFFIIDATVTRGAFTSEDARRTADVLFHFAWGVPAFVLAKVFTPPFFARQDTKRPMIYALIGVGISTAVGFGLFTWLPSQDIDPVIGLAIATSATGWLNVLLLAGTLAREGHYRIDGALWSKLVRLLLACAAMAALLIYCEANYAQIYGWLWRKEMAVVAMAAAGGLIFFLVAWALRAFTIREIRSALRRERAPEGVPPGLSGAGD